MVAFGRHDQGLLGPLSEDMTIARWITLAICLFLGSAGVLAGGGGVLLGLEVIPGEVAIDATSDSEFRFLSAFWAAFGLLCFWIARRLDDRKRYIFFMATVMAAGGAARILSLAVVGPPHPNHLRALFPGQGTRQLLGRPGPARHRSRDTGAIA